MCVFSFIFINFIWVKVLNPTGPRQYNFQGKCSKKIEWRFRLKRPKQGLRINCFSVQLHIVVRKLVIGGILYTVNYLKKQVFTL